MNRTAHALIPYEEASLAGQLVEADEHDEDRALLEAVTDYLRATDALVERCEDSCGGG